MKKLWVSAALTAAAIVCVRPAAAAAASPTPAAPAAAVQEQIAPYLTPQRLVRVGPGRSINLVCLGHGSPTIVLTAGLGNWSGSEWWKVQRPLARRTRVCAWDPAGYGFSSPSPEPQDIVHTTEDLAMALKGAGIEGPYVMVSQSLGAYDALRFTDLYRQSVVGMVLVDPSIPDQVVVRERVAPKLAAIAPLQRGVKQLQDCAAELGSGALRRGTPRFEQCTASPSLDPPAVWSGLAVTLARLNANPARLLTQASSQKEFPEDSREVINANRHYGNLPLIVLTAGRDADTAIPLPPLGAPGIHTLADRAELRKEIVRFFKDAWGPAHDAYAALSTRGRNQLVPDSGHRIPTEKPAAVISAVSEVLSEIRPSSPTSLPAPPVN